MNTKRMVMFGTHAAAITLEGSAIVDGANIRPPSQFDTFKAKTPSRSAFSATDEDVLLETLGASAEEVRSALYNGKALADIAIDHKKDVQAIIDLQIAEMTAQLDARLASGSITFDQYQTHKEELAEIITRSCYAQA